MAGRDLQNGRSLPGLFNIIRFLAVIGRASALDEFLLD
jgi:hypothetical protein